VQLDVVFDRSQGIRASIDDVQRTLLIAGLLVVGVIFVFLRRVSAPSFRRWPYPSPLSAPSPACRLLASTWTIFP